MKPLTDYFIEDDLRGWDGRIYLRSVPGKLDWMELTKPLPCGNGLIPIGFRFNGASSGPLRYVPLLGFPKWRHPIATCRHDWRCEKAQNDEQRRFADCRFREDIKIGQKNKVRSWWEQAKGFLGVRAGAIFGIGNSF